MSNIYPKRERQGRLPTMNPIALIIFLALFVLWLALWVRCLGQIAISTTPDVAAKSVWVLIVTIFPVIGILLWWGVGKTILGYAPQVKPLVPMR